MKSLKGLAKASQGKTLEQLGAELQRQRNSRADFIADTRQLNFSTENNKSRITFENGGKTMDFGINPLAHQQIASRLGIPLKYYQRMQAEAPALLDENVNNWLEQTSARRMLRIMDVNVRAFLSDRYRRLESLMLSGFIEVMNEYYSRNLAREVLKGLKENALKCKHTGGFAPLGYDVDPLSKVLVINEREARAVKKIFQMIIGGASYETIIRALKKEGFKTKAGNDFGKNSIYEILRNPKYKGDYVWAKVASKDPITKKRNNHKMNDPENMIIIEGGVPRIVSDEDFEKVQNILKERQYRSYHSKRNRETYLLSGKIFCGNCGSRYVGNRKNSSRNKPPTITYRCNTRDRKTKDACQNREINRDYLEGFVIEQIEKAIFNKEMVDMIRESFKNYIVEQNSEHNAEINRLKHAIKGLEQQEKNLLSTISEGATEQVRDVILKKLDEVISAKKELNENLLVKESSFSLDIPSKAELEACFIEARKMFRAKTLSDMQNLIDLYVEKVIVYENEVEVILNLVPLFYRHEFTNRSIKIHRDDLKNHRRFLH